MLLFKKKKIPKNNCFNCGNKNQLIEGFYLCKSDPSHCVIEDDNPGEDFLGCKGIYWEKKSNE